MSDGSNPWLSRPTEPEHAVPVVTESAVRPPTGPVAPQRGVPSPDRADQLASYDQAQPGESHSVVSIPVKPSTALLT